MKVLSEKAALEKLSEIKATYRNHIKNNYEHRAKDCLTCETQGICCVDEHFVNIHVSRLEAVAISENLKNLSEDKQGKVYSRIEETIEKYDLKNTEDSSTKTFACPLFEKGIGCLVHAVKPVPCIQHACYERKEDLPPDELQTEAEEKISRLDQKAYRQNSLWLPLPVWLSEIKNSGK